MVVFAILWSSMLFKKVSLATKLLPARASEQGNWASEASPTLGCSIEISRGMSVGMYVCLSYVSRMSNHVESRESNTRMLKVSIGR